MDTQVVAAHNGGGHHNQPYPRLSSTCMHTLCYLETKPGTPHHKRITNIGPGNSVSQDVQRVFLSVLLQSLLQALPRLRHLHKGPRNHPIVHKHATHAVSIAADHALAG
ncbi:polyribonucleotide 5'-hydroxyl-kinase [Trypanosoma cruzi]|nr:polyribonucleotide 5'-hydroxyl-kinase [Trypanosoma cruzi]